MFWIELRLFKKKLDSTTKENNIAFKGNLNNLQIVVACNTAVYELLKSVFKSSLRDQGLYVTVKEGKDQSKSVVSVVISAKSKKKGKHLFTANFYNTTSTILVNGIKDPNQFLDQYAMIIEKIPQSTIVSLNESIQKSCVDAISNSRPFDVDNASQVSLPDSMSSHSDTSMSEELSNSQEILHSVTPASTKPTTTASTVPLLDTTHRCHTCHLMDEKLQTMMNKLLDLENCVKQQNNIIEKLIDKPTIESFKEDIINLANNVNSKLECFSNSIPPNTYQNKPATSQQMWSGVLRSNLSASTSRQVPQHMNISPTSNITKTINDGASTSKSAQHVKMNNSLNKSTKNIGNISKSGVKFIPEKCVVISGKCENIRQLSRDTIRHTVCANHGPLLIDNITPYKFSSEHPKFIVQFSSVDVAKRVADGWKNDSFGGSSARKTIKPDENINVGMMRGVPLDIADDIIQQSIGEVFAGATIIRLLKDGKKLRTIKVKFVNSEMLDIAVKNGITITSCNMMFRIELPYSSTTANNYV